MLRKERTNDHPTPIMLPAAIIELPHGSINNRVSCLSFTPSFEVLLVILPVDIGVFGLERRIHTVNISCRLCYGQADLPDIWPMGHDVLVEISPGHLADPSLNTLIARIEPLGSIMVPSRSDGSSCAQGSARKVDAQ